MKYIVETDKAVDQAATDLEQAVARHGFGVLHVHDLGNTLRAKGIDFQGECRIYEVCQPQRAAEVLAEDMDLNMVLPCRISVYRKGDSTCIGTLLPTGLLQSLSDSPQLMEVARAVEQEIVAMIDEAGRAP